MGVKELPQNGLGLELDMDAEAIGSMTLSSLSPVRSLRSSTLKLARNIIHFDICDTYSQCSIVRFQWAKCIYDDSCRPISKLMGALKPVRFWPSGFLNPCFIVISPWDFTAATPKRERFQLAWKIFVGNIWKHHWHLIWIWRFAIVWEVRGAGWFLILKLL